MYVELLLAVGIDFETDYPNLVSKGNELFGQLVRQWRTAPTPNCPPLAPVVDEVAPMEAPPEPERLRHLALFLFKMASSWCPHNACV